MLDGALRRPKRHDSSAGNAERAGLNARARRGLRFRMAVPTALRAAGWPDWSTHSPSCPLVKEDRRLTRPAACESTALGRASVATSSDHYNFRRAVHIQSSPRADLDSHPLTVVEGVDLHCLCRRPLVAKKHSSADLLDRLLAPYRRCSPRRLRHRQAEPRRHYSTRPPAAVDIAPSAFLTTSTTSATQLRV